MPKSKVSWKEVKRILSKVDNNGLLKLIGELYTLNKDNKRYIHVKYGSSNPLEVYKHIISQNISPEILHSNEQINLSKAKHAISEYRKAVGKPDEILELMIYYVECGNDFTVEYGDMYEAYYLSIESMFRHVVKTLKGADAKVIDTHLPRLEKIVNKAEGMGWGYYDGLVDILAEAFPDAAI